MIGRDQIAEACRYLDAIAEEGRSFDELVAERNIDLDGLMYVGEQRAIRIALIYAGVDPTSLPRDRMTGVDPPQPIKNLIKPCQLAFIDGLMAGRTLSDPADRIQRFPERGDT